MVKYKVKIIPRAIRDLDSIYEYIAKEKSALENAKGQGNRIKKIILTSFHNLIKNVTRADMQEKAAGSC